MTRRDGWAREMWRKAVPSSARSGLYAVRQEAGRAGKEALTRLYGGRPVPLWAVAALRAMVLDKDGLLPPDGAFTTDGSSLVNAYLRRRLAGRELGQWSLPAAALNYLENQVRIRKPDAILEFGSGISTLCLARYMLELHGESGGPYVFSIDQDPQFLLETARLLEAAGLSRYVRLCHAPLAQQQMLGRTTTCYALPEDRLAALLGEVRPDFVLIDGPAADEGRFGTLPLVCDWLRPAAPFFLDDALRDNELRDARVWATWPPARLEGYWLVGRGLLLGQVIPSGVTRAAKPRG